MALAVCAAGLGMAGTSTMALAGDSFTLQATATVQGNCKLRSGVANGGTLTLAFGTLDASTIAADAVQTSLFQYSCNNGTTVTA
ncbi:MAG TPA: spore coat protein U domain-containing protein, partial [Burkholderiales bacterium]|nr:spore coat protein U domain-containing protein [Burkholderiales bacterium]